MKYFIKEVIESVKNNDLQITAFYPYTTVVRHRLSETSHFTIDDDDECKLLRELWELLENEARELGIHLDNKIAFRLQYGELSNYEIQDSGLFFVGMYDGAVSIGLKVSCEDYGNRGVQFFPYVYKHNHIEAYVESALRDAGWKVEKLEWIPKTQEDETSELKAKVKRFDEMGSYSTKMLNKLTKNLLIRFNIELELI